MVTAMGTDTMRRMRHLNHHFLKDCLQELK
jgi:hypothetical protein